VARLARKYKPPVGLFGDTFGTKLKGVEFTVEHALPLMNGRGSIIVCVDGFGRRCRVFSISSGWHHQLTQSLMPDDLFRRERPGIVF
jgi:hypothetical protein